MATLSVLKFDDPYGADRVLIALQGLHERRTITLVDAAVVSRPQGNNRPKTRQLHSTAGAGAGWGAFWGFLFGMLFFIPLLGAALGAGMGAIGGSLANVGIDHDFVKQVREKVTEGTSALFALTSGAPRPTRSSTSSSSTTSRSSRPTCPSSRRTNCARPSRRSNRRRWSALGWSTY